LGEALADLSCMGAAVDFERILNEKLAATRPLTTAPPAVPILPASDPGLWFLALGWRRSPSPLMAGARIASYKCPWTPPMSPSGCATGDSHSGTRSRWRRRRALGAPGRRALDQLRRCGAIDLGEDFTTDELRRAYRVLAKRYHPDRHPGATELERARLAEAFAEVTSAYRHLRSTHSHAD
jgi:hypothetical protein